MKFANVLVIEDKPDMASVFENQGLTVVTVANKKEALEALGAYSFEVVVTDMSMPLLDGFEICKMLHKDLPVVAVSSNSDHSAKFDDVCDCLIEKPEIQERLFKAAMKAIERRNVSGVIAA